MLKPIITSVVTALVVSLAVIGMFLKGADQTPAPELSGTVSDLDQSVGNLTASGLVSSNGVTFFQKVITLTSGDNYESWLNQIGQTLYVTDATIITGATASSSSKLYLYATTSPAVLRSGEHFTAPTVDVTNRILSGVLLATSSAATTTSSINEAAYNVLSSNLTNGVVPVANGERILLWLQNATASGGVPAGRCSFNATASSCDAATSTNSVYPVTAVVRGFFASEVEVNAFTK